MFGQVSLAGLTLTESMQNFAKDFGAILTASPFAIWAAISAWRQRRVPRAGPMRLLGYVALWIAPVLLALGAAVAIRENVVQPFRIPSGSMAPTLEPGDYIAAVPTRGLSDIHLGDVVVYRLDGEARDFAKRVIALPAQRIAFRNGAPVLDGRPVPRDDLGSGRNLERSSHRFRERLWSHVYIVE
jgi:signal peptidase I